MLQKAISPVFQEMFEADMEERKTHSVTITDFPAVAVKEFVHYLYHFKGTSEPVMGKYAIEVWALADKYQVDCCKQYITQLCHSFVNKDNVVDFLACAERYNAIDIRN